MAYLTQDHLIQALARGRGVEQWLGSKSENGNQLLKWVFIQREAPPNTTYCVVLNEVYEEGDPNLNELSRLDADEPDGKLFCFETREEALDHVINELGGSLDRFVRDGEIQQEYEKYLRERDTAI